MEWKVSWLLKRCQSA